MASQLALVDVQTFRHEGVSLLGEALRTVTVMGPGQIDTVRVLWAQIRRGTFVNI